MTDIQTDRQTAIERTERVWGSIFPMQKWSPVLPETNFLSLQLCSSTPYKSPVLLETNFLSLQLCSSSPYRDRLTNRQTDLQRTEKVWGSIFPMQKWSPVIPETNFLSLQICSRFPYRSPVLPETTFLSLQLCSSSPYRCRQTNRHVQGDRQILGDHFSYVKIVSGVTGDKIFIFATLF